MIEMRMRARPGQRQQIENATAVMMIRMASGRSVGLPVLMLFANIGRPSVFGKISSRKKCNCPMTPTLVPLCRFTGIIASIAN